MDLIEKPEKKPGSSLMLIVMLTLASFVLYTITYYFIESNPLLPLQSILKHTHYASSLQWSL